ncbi:MAG: hypothetical protein ACP5GR_00495 [Thermoplasmata archaeon]
MEEKRGAIKVFLKIHRHGIFGSKEIKEMIQFLEEYVKRFSESKNIKYHFHEEEKEYFGFCMEGDLDPEIYKKKFSNLDEILDEFGLRKYLRDIKKISAFIYIVRPGEEDPEDKRPPDFFYEYDLSEKKIPFNP